MVDTDIITSSSNSIVKQIKLLHKKRERWNKKSFFIEGIRAVEQSILAKAEIEYIVYSEKLFTNNGGKDLLEEVKKRNYKTYHISDKLFKDIGDTEQPQGILAVVRFKEYELEDILLSESNFLIVLDRVQDPGNMGTIIRTADAFGANGIIVTSGCVDIYNPKTIRSTMGSIFQIPIVHFDDIKECIMNLKKNNIEIIATSLDTNKYSYDVDLKSDCALVIGNEASGISKDVLDNSDYLIKIPMTGEAESLNAAVASGVVMYEVLRQRSKTL
ncbi:tRNA/rRNA methyltransferase SpoU [Gottschalkia acidurici 9a]|uniref:tRNA/rRNA methyltransferase SpoU n=1 Tax=Gottschalkia acidurici (strain ATCC 7906 / DSM 604 / BCRC 14475 / CIP 104303 / KCTC 5404 / NCIMB 10678 / 9a) TaxID=1128398 RepID=K0AVQ2_GOTA9|nr:23S rRNA (guanosine(2251)-2'-O)-methyltransferase RlmB [Gottschalkia acidurici]AFS77928.1 tRNA/rRNA methyltransferase SpoU [Gottschalkia acidurici 9a]